MPNGRNRNNRRTSTTKTAAPAASTKPAAPAADNTGAIVTALTVDGATAESVAAVIGTIMGRAARRDAVAAVPGRLLVDHAANLAPLVAMLVAADALAGRPTTAATIPPPAPNDVLAALAAYVIGIGTSDGTAAGSVFTKLVTAATAVVRSTYAADGVGIVAMGAASADVLARAGIGGRATTRRASDGGPRTRTDRSGGRDASRLVGITLTGPNDATASVGADGAVSVTGGAADGQTFRSLSSAANAADGGDAASYNGWVAWRAVDGRTADAIARGDAAPVS